MGRGLPTSIGAGILATHTGDTSGAHAASAIDVTPAGSIVATDVQAAIVELDDGTTDLTATVDAINRPALTAPPALANWTLLGSPTATDEVASGQAAARILFTQAGTAGASVKAAYRDLPAGTSWTVTIRSTYTGPGTNYVHHGIMVREGGASAKLATFGWFSTAAGPGNAINVNKYTNLTTAVPYVLQQLAGGYRAPAWWRITRAASTLTYQLSFDGVDWCTFGTSNVTTDLGFTVAPTQWGFFLDTWSGTTYTLKYSVDHVTEV